MTTRRGPFRSVSVFASPDFGRLCPHVAVAQALLYLVGMNTKTGMNALLSSEAFEKKVQVVSSQGAMIVCTNCPRVLPGATLRLRLDDQDNNTSYLFRVLVTSTLCDLDREHWTVHFMPLATPVILSWGRGRAEAPEAVLELEQSIRAA